MATALGFFILGLFLLALGGDSIIKGASGLAQKLGLSPFASGLLLVAFGTSLPELAVNARAVWVGSQSLALGNAIGSNVVNFGFRLNNLPRAVISSSEPAISITTRPRLIPPSFRTSPRTKRDPSRTIPAFNQNS